MAGQPDLLQRAIELAHIGLAQLDATGRFVSANAGFLSMLGAPETDLLGQHWHASVHPDDRGRAQEAYRTARTDGQGYVEIRALRHDSLVLYQAVTITRITDERGVFTGYNCLRHDISGSKRNQEALALVVESAPNGLLMADSAGLILSVNRAVEKLFGYTRDELVGRTVETLLPERFRQHHQRQRDEFNTRASMKAAGRDLCGVRKDGAEIPLQVYLNRIETDSGGLILCTIIDIAERVRYQQQLELAKKTAEAANRAKSDFLARMSHEIRTPMNLINGMNTLLLESELNEKQRQHVEISYRNVRRLLRLINGILDLSKVEAGQLTLVAAPFDLQEALNECAATISSTVEQKGLQFKMSVDPDVWRYWIGDAERLQQVLLNVIGNAVKFTDRGKIEVRVLAECAGQDKRGVRFEVTDTGCGVPPDKSTMIFEAFQQADGAMNRPYEGTGLGLAIAKTLVEMMLGRIWVEQKAEPGARFVFTAFFQPGTQEDVCGKKCAAASKHVSGVEAGARILLVEDNPENMILLRAYLENLSPSLDFASNGVEALESRKRGSYDLVLMDIQMPVMDGYTATREIRAWEKEHRAPRVPIVALTAHALSGAHAESIAAGCDGHLTKPVEQNDMVEAIAKFAKRAANQSLALPEVIAARRPAFLANRRLDLARMQEALAARDFPTVQAIGHNCKGTGIGYGFPDISKLGSAIEEAAKGLDADGLEESFQQFDRCILAGSAEGSSVN
jgi:PAS domain S-box-containing protein